jgi:hypothetical protein
VHEARGLDRKKPNLERKRQDTPRFKNIPKKNVQKDLGGVKTLHRGLGGYTRRVRSRAPTRKNYDATTPVHEPLSLCESVPNSPKGSGATVGYLKLGVPTIND